MPLGKTLKALRQKQGLNQKGLSAISGVSQATISRIETGRVRQLRSAALKNLADALSVTVDFLMGDSEVFAPTADDQPINPIPGVREDRFRQIADSLDPFVIHEGGRILYINQALSDILGYRREELLGKNGLELLVAPRSRGHVERMIQTGASEPYEILLVRKDNTVFPVEISGHNLTETARLGVVRNIAMRRCQQTVERVLRAGMEVDDLADFSKVIRILADELADLGLPFDAVGVNIIDEKGDRFTSYCAYPEGRGYQTFYDDASLQQALAQYAPVRTLVSHWHRDKMWEREPDDAFIEMVRQSTMGTSYQPGLVVDVPFVQGTLTLGITTGHNVRSAEIAALMQALSQPISFVIKHLQLLRDCHEKAQH